MVQNNKINASMPENDKVEFQWSGKQYSLNDLPLGQYATTNFYTKGSGGGGGAVTGNIDSGTY